MSSSPDKDSNNPDEDAPQLRMDCCVSVATSTKEKILMSEKTNQADREVDVEETANPDESFQDKGFEPHPAVPYTINEIVEAIQPLPTFTLTRGVGRQRQDSEPGAFATVSANPFPPRRAQDLEAAADQEEYLVEASLVEPPREIPMAEIVSPSREGSVTDSVHDQHSSSSKRERRRLCWGATAVIALALAALAISGVVCGTGHCNTTDEESTDPFDTIAMIPLQNTAVTVDALATVGFGLPNYTLPALSDPASPQSKAYDWLSSEYFDLTMLTMDRWRTQQIFVLATLYFSFYDEVEEGGWLDATQPECHWTSTTGQKFDTIFFKCSDSGRITSLHLNNFQNKLIPRELELLSDLEILAVKNSGLTGPLEDLVSSELVSSLSGSLERLSFANNALTGSIPTYLMDLTKLTGLHLDRNQLSGEIPTEVSLLTNLETLSVFGNNLEGEIPSEVGQLSSLAYISAIWNGFSGSLPSEIGLLTALSFLSLHSNQIGGSLPSQVGQLQSLQSLDISSNKLSGALPTEMVLLDAIASLVLWGNQLTGPIPSRLTQVTNLVELDLAANTFTGVLPPELGLLTGLTRLSLYECQLEGTLPTELGLLTNLADLWLQQNQFTGTLPMELGLLTRLEWLSLYTNVLTGEVATELGLLTELKVLDTNSNEFWGEIPSELGLLTQLTELSLFFNELEGDIPTGLGLLTSLEHLHLQENNLSGAVPESVCFLTELAEGKLYDFSLDCREEVLCPAGCGCTFCS